MLSNKVGIRFGRLVVVTQSRVRGWGTVLRCRCDCGAELEVPHYNLVSGNTTSCGCSRTTHGMSKTRIYAVWKGMLDRCYRKTATGYKNYGGRGIAVCDRWHRFENFFADIGEPPERGLKLDRIDNNADYQPGNCRWSTSVQQHNNKRTNVMLTAFGQTKTLTAWAAEYGIHQRTLHNRIKRAGMSVEVALTTPLHGRIKK